MAAARCAWRRERAEIAWPGGLTYPSLGSRSVAYPLALCPEGSGDPGLGGGGTRREGPRGTAGARRWPGGRLGMRRCPSSVCLSISRWICLRLEAAGAMQGPGGSAPRSPAAAAARAWEARLGRSRLGPPRWSPRRSESHGSPQGSLVGAEEEARAATAVSSFAASSNSHPRELPSLAGCLGGSGPARAGGGGGGAAEGGERAGGRRGVLFGDGAGAERERPRRRPHPAGNPGSWAPWPRALPSATSLRAVGPQVRAGIGLQGSGTAGSDPQGALGLGGRGGGCEMGKRGEHLLGEGRRDRRPIS